MSGLVALLDDVAALARLAAASVDDVAAGAAKASAKAAGDVVVLGGGDPLNVLAWLPNQGRYSPLWDVHLTQFAPGRTPTRFTQFADVEKAAEAGTVTGFPGGPWGPSGFIVNCPIIAQV